MKWTFVRVVFYATGRNPCEYWACGLSYMSHHCFLEERRHIHGQEKDIVIFLQIFRINQILLGDLRGIFFAERIQRSMALIAGGFHLDRADFIALCDEKIDLVIRCSRWVGKGMIV